MKTLDQRLQALAQFSPDRVAFAFHDEDEDAAPEEWTFKQLDERSSAVAAALAARGIRRGRAILLFPSGLPFLAGFYGAMRAGLVAVPTYPPDPARLDRSLPRLLAIARDASPAVVLTTEPLLALARSQADRAPELLSLPWIAVDQLAQGEHLAPASVRPGDDAFLQYTSGSTASPKGVRITHQNICAQMELFERNLGFDSDSRFVSWLPVYHDMGLVGKLLTPVWFGAFTAFLSPTTFLRHPYRWLATISSQRGTISAAPDFAYSLAAARISEAEKATLDLSSWSTAVNGAEPPRADTIRRFSRAFAPCGFRPEAMMPSYGLAEATLQVSGRPRSTPPLTLSVDAQALRGGRLVPAADGQILLSSGQPHEGLEVGVLSEKGTLCGPGEIGEIVLQGPSVSPGYHGRPPRGGEPLRTGDLGALWEGELYVTGRIKDLIILGGANHHPHDLEWTLEGCHPKVRPGRIAAFALQQAGRDEEGVGVLVEVDEADPAIVSAVRERLADRQGLTVSAVGLLPLGALPKTSSGKLQRHRCARGWTEGSLSLLHRWSLDTDPSAAATPPTGELGQDTLLRWMEAEIRRLGGQFSPDISFVAQGLDSRRGLELLGALEQRLGRKLETSSLYDHSTPRALASALGAPERPAPAPARGRGTGGGGAVGIRGLALRLPGAADPEALWSLMEGGEVSVGEPPEARRAEGARGPAGWLDRIEAVEPGVVGLPPAEAAAMDPEQHLLLKVVWEALADAGVEPASLSGQAVGVYIGMSGAGARVPAGEAGPWTATGASPAIAANRISYLLDLRGPSMTLDTACSSGLTALHLAAQAIGQGEVDLAIVAAVNLLRDPAATEALAAAGFLSDRCRTFAADGRGYVRAEGAVAVVLDRDPAGGRAVLLGSAQNQDGRTNGLTAPSARAQTEVIRRAWAAASRTPDEATLFELHGTGTALGDPIETEALVRARSAQAPPVLVGALKANIGHTEAVAGLAGLARLILCLERRRVPPQVAVEVPNPRIPWERLRLSGGEPWSPGPAGLSAFSFGGSNVHVVVGPAPGPRHPQPLPPPWGSRPAPKPRPALDVQSRLEGALVDVLGRYDAARDRDTSLVDLGLDSMLALALAAKLERELGVPWPVDRLLGGLSPQELLAPVWGGPLDAPAPFPARLLAAIRDRQDVVASDEARELSGAELADWILGLAGALVEQGVAPGDRVGICLPRGLGALASLAAISWAGGAWVAVDPSWPASRRQDLLRRAGVRCVLGTPGSSEQAEELRVLDPHTLRSATRAGCSATEGLAYILFTSGSTGTPKGVAVGHRALSLHLAAFAERLGLGDRAVGPRWLSVTALSFDISIAELLLPLLHGGSVHLVSDETARDGQRLRARVEATGPGWLQATPSTWRMLLYAGWEGQAELQAISGGEALPRPLADSLRARCRRLWNAYGPTEATIWATLGPVEGEVSIGRPLPGYRLRLHEGELWIGGEGLAQGYWSDPERTASSFVQHDGERWYRTGDAVRLLEDGSWAYQGRLDNQVKLQGVRVEPGEVEAALEQLPGVHEAVVRPWRGSLVAFVVADSPEATLRAALAERLPAHLVPARIYGQDHLPRLSSGKIDRNALVPPEQAAPEEAAGAGAAEGERASVTLLTGLWSEVLGAACAPETDFFAAGGDSVLATALMLRIRAVLGQELPMNALTEAPTPQALLRVLSEPQPRELDLLSDAKLDPAWLPGPRPTEPPRRLLMTGATGFLGRVLLAELLRETDWEVRCLLRCASVEEGQRRLGPGRAVAVPGDLTRPRLGLSLDEWQRQAEEVDLILHNGALVNFVFPYSAMRAANVEGTLQVLALAAEGRPKHLHHVSTVAVFESEGYAEAEEVAEDADLDRSTGLWDGYPQSKWVSERLVQEAARRGLSASIYRPGMVTGPAWPRTEDPHALNPGDFIFRMIRGCAGLGVAPDLDTLVELVPVDYVAAALVRLARDAGPGTWHLTNPHPLPCDEFLSTLGRLGYPMDRLPWEEWRLHALRHLQPDSPLYPLIPFFGTRRDPRSMRLPHFLTDQTREALGPDGPVCPPVGDELMGRYVGWLEARGLLDRAR